MYVNSFLYFTPNSEIVGFSYLLLFDDYKLT